MPRLPSMMRPGKFSRRRAMKKMLVLLGVLLAAFTMISPLRAQQAPPLDELKKTAIAEVDKLQTFPQQMVDEIYSYSELGFQEFETSRYVSGILEKNGFHVERGVAGIPTAWVASWGGGKPVIAFITDLDCIPRASQKPGVAYHDPIIDGAPGHGEGHNSGMAVNVTAALVLKKVSAEHKNARPPQNLPGGREKNPGAKSVSAPPGR